MIHEFNPVSRRKFLHKGIGLSALFLLRPEILPFSICQRADKSGNANCDRRDDVLEDVVLRYGSEFGDIRTSRRSQDRGCV